MEFRELGRTGLNVSRIALGCGNFGGIGSAPAFFGRGETREEAFRLLDAAFDLGVRLLDTADAYGGGRSETWIGEWLAARPRARAKAIVSTKVFHSVEGDPADHGLAPARVRRQIEGSLRRLGVERVDMYLTHEPDPETPIGETLAAFDELVRAGKVGAVGLSNVDGPQLAEALAAGDARGLPRVGWVQNSYSLLDREAEREVLPLCAAEGLGFTPFSPLAGGWLTGKYRAGEAPPEGSRMKLRPEPYLHLRADRVYRALDGLAAAAADKGVSTAGLAVAWLLAQPRVDAVILGPRRPDQLEPAREALGNPLTPSERDELGLLFA